VLPGDNRGRVSKKRDRGFGRGSPRGRGSGGSGGLWWPAPPARGVTKGPGPQTAPAGWAKVHLTGYQGRCSPMHRMELVRQGPGGVGVDGFAWARGQGRAGPVVRDVGGEGRRGTGPFRAGDAGVSTGLHAGVGRSATRAPVVSTVDGIWGKGRSQRTGPPRKGGREGAQVPNAPFADRQDWMNFAAWRRILRALGMGQAPSGV